MKTQLLIVPFLTATLSTIANANNWCSSSAYDKQSKRVEGTCSVIGDGAVQIDKDYVTSGIRLLAIDENGKQFFFQIKHPTADINLSSLMLPNNDYPLALISGAASPLWKDLEKQGLKHDGKRWTLSLVAFELTPTETSKSTNQIYKDGQKLSLNVPRPKVVSGCKWGTVEQNKPSNPKRPGPYYSQLYEESDRSDKIDPGFCAQHMLPGVKKICFGNVTCDGEDDVAVCEASGDNACPTPDECFYQGFRNNLGNLANKPRSRADLFPSEEEKVKFDLSDYANYSTDFYVREIEATGVPSQGVCVGNAVIKVNGKTLVGPCIAVFTNSGCPDARTCQLQECFKSAPKVGDVVPRPQFKSYINNPVQTGGNAAAGGRR